MSLKNSFYLWIGFCFTCGFVEGYCNVDVPLVVRTDK